jgi:hypothetical protein
VYRLVSYSEASEKFIKIEVEKKTLFGRKKEVFDFVLVNANWDSCLKFWVDISTGKYANALGLAVILSACLSKENIKDSGFRR